MLKWKCNYRIRKVSNQDNNDLIDNMIESYLVLFRKRKIEKLNGRCIFESPMRKRGTKHFCTSNRENFNPTILEIACAKMIFSGCHVWSIKELQIILSICLKTLIFECTVLLYVIRNMNQNHVKSWKSYTSKSHQIFIFKSISIDKFRNIEIKHPSTL